MTKPPHSNLIPFTKRIWKTFPCGTQEKKDIKVDISNFVSTLSRQNVIFRLENEQEWKLRFEQLVQQLKLLYEFVLRPTVH